MDLYAEEILDHYRHPRNKAAVTPSFLVDHREKNPACGDEIRVGFGVKNGVISELVWEGEGCAISQAAMSMLSEELPGKSLETIEKLTPNDVLQLLKVPISQRRIKCALLCLHAVQNGVRIHQSQKLWSWAETVGKGD